MWYCVHMTVKDILRKKGLRATPHRVALLGTLATANTPKTAEELFGRMKSMDLVTVYRNLESLRAAGLVNEVRFKDTNVRYEISDGDSHHHHLVCTSCGLVAELDECDLRPFEKQALKKSGKFASVEEHSLEFYGTCIACTRR